MTRVALIAVAKDEDAYIHEWIHHHLFMGFSPLYIGINRCTDKTLDVLNKITKQRTDIHVFNLDWLDKATIDINRRIQNFGYAYLSSKIDKNEIDYVGYLDIDEFWFNVNGKKIQDFVQEYKPFNIASFFWLCQWGEDRQFAPPFKQVYYEIPGLVKSIISTAILDKIKIFTMHVPSFASEDYLNLSHIDQHGHVLSQLNADKICNGQQPKICKKNITTAILHRIMRSEPEYLSLVLRGNTNGELIKSNYRQGFKKASKKLAPILAEDYYQSLHCFIETHDLSEILQQARTAKLEFYQHKINAMTNEQLINEIDNAIMALADTHALSLFVATFVQKVTDADTLGACPRI